MDVTTDSGYCPHCERTCRTVEGKPWLPTVCRECGRNL